MEETSLTDSDWVPCLSLSQSQWPRGRDALAVDSVVESPQSQPSKAPCALCESSVTGKGRRAFACFLRYQNARLSSEHESTQDPPKVFL